MAKTYKTKRGDMWDFIALLFYAEERLASKLIEANPEYVDVIVFDEGVELIIPDIAEVEHPITLPPWRRDE